MNKTKPLKSWKNWIEGKKIISNKKKVLEELRTPESSEEAPE